MTEPLAAAAAPAAPTRLSPIERAVRVFVRPQDAWEGLAERGQWWFPLLLTLLLGSVLLLAVYERSLVPMLENQWSEQVANGRMQPEAVSQARQFMVGSPAGRIAVVVQQIVMGTVFVLLQALLVWFGTGFVLGTRMRFRPALEVVLWGGLVKIPQVLLFFAMAYSRETLEGIHLGLGILVPEPDTPSKLITGLQSFLDLFGPFEAWWVAVAVLGASRLSGAPRRSVAWVLVAIYLAVGTLFAAVAAFLTPSA